MHSRASTPRVARSGAALRHRARASSTRSTARERSVQDSVSGRSHRSIRMSPRSSLSAGWTRARSKASRVSWRARSASSGGRGAVRRTASCSSSTAVPKATMYAKESGRIRASSWGRQPCSRSRSSLPRTSWARSSSALGAAVSTPSSARNAVQSRTRATGSSTWDANICSTRCRVARSRHRASANGPAIASNVSGVGSPSSARASSRTAHTGSRA